MATRAKSKRAPSRGPWRSWIALGLTAGVLLWFWDHPVVWPLKILVVLFHELGHAAAALATGGEVIDIGLSPQQGGVTHTRGGWSFLILNAGYLGSLAAGVGLLFLGRRPKTAAVGAWLVVLVLLVSTALWLRPVASFAFGFAVLALLGAAALARFGSSDLRASALRGLGVFSVLYALWDIRSDVFGAPEGTVSDATMLAEMTFIPAPFWGALWLVAGVSVLIALRRWLLA